MEDICTYQVEVRGQVDENEINAVGPLQIRVIQSGTASTLFIVHTDQSGIIGLMRLLNGHGVVVLAIRRGSDIQ